MKVLLLSLPPVKLMPKSPFEGWHKKPWTRSNAWLLKYPQIVKGTTKVYSAHTTSQAPRIHGVFLTNDRKPLCRPISMLQGRLCPCCTKAQAGSKMGSCSRVVCRKLQRMNKANIKGGVWKRNDCRGEHRSRASDQNFSSKLQPEKITA